jgi:hypothetical protein
MVTAIRITLSIGLVIIMWCEVHWSVGTFALCSLLGHEATGLVLRKNSLI